MLPPESRPPLPEYLHLPLPREYQSITLSVLPLDYLTSGFFEWMIIQGSTRPLPKFPAEPSSAINANPPSTGPPSSLTAVSTETDVEASGTAASTTAMPPSSSSSASMASSSLLSSASTTPTSSAPSSPLFTPSSPDMDLPSSSLGKRVRQASAEESDANVVLGPRLKLIRLANGCDVSSLLRTDGPSSSNMGSSA